AYPDPGHGRLPLLGRRRRGHQRRPDPWTGVRRTRVMADAAPGRGRHRCCPRVEPPLPACAGADGPGPRRLADAGGLADAGVPRAARRPHRGDADRLAARRRPPARRTGRDAAARRPAARRSRIALSAVRCGSTSIGWGGLANPDGKSAPGSGVNAVGPCRVPARRNRDTRTSRVSGCASLAPTCDAGALRRPPIAPRAVRLRTAPVVRTRSRPAPRPPAPRTTP